MPSIMAGVAVSVLTQVTPTLPRDMDVEFLPSIYVEVAEEVSIPIKVVAEAYRLSFHPGVQIMDDLANAYDDLLPKWSK